MSVTALLRKTTPSYLLKLSKTEDKILKTLLNMKSGNAYGIWKTSKLKHYPTVLRILKKLTDRGYTKVLDSEGPRSEKTYFPTLIGQLVLHTSRGNQQKIIDILLEESRIFRELYEVDDNVYFPFAIIHGILMSVHAKKEPRNIDELIRDKVEDNIYDALLNLHDEAVQNDLLKIASASWVKPLMVRAIDDEVERHNRVLRDLKDLRKDLNLTERKMEGHD